MHTRRRFLKSAAAVALGFGGLRHLGAFGAAHARRAPGYGDLVPDPEGLFDLPKGFSYRVVSRTGDAMSDGLLVPGRPDGMAAFTGPRGLTLIVRNHEVNPDDDPELGAFGPANERHTWIGADRYYDHSTNGAPALGGTSTVVYDTGRQEVVSQHLSLAGTLRNCAGGPTPWNSWITCEESVVRANDRFTRDHGFCFEVPASADPRLAEPVPLKDMGRFNHEAVAVDPASGVVYETEDRGDGLIYRFVPNRPGHLREGGRLQALAVVGQPSVDLRNWDGNVAMTPGESIAVTWIDLEDVEAPQDDLRLRGFEAGAARFARGEGMWYGNEAVYFACTNGGAAKAGQIWRYRPSQFEGTDRERENPGMLELFVEPNDRTLIEHADNLTVAPWGHLVVCEDGPEQQYLRGITPDGAVYPLGRNALNESELCGATFSPDGSTLFFNIQSPGITLAVTGPWVR